MSKYLGKEDKYLQALEIHFNIIKLLCNNHRQNESCLKRDFWLK